MPGEARLAVEFVVPFMSLLLSVLEVRYAGYPVMKKNHFRSLIALFLFLGLSASPGATSRVEQALDGLLERLLTSLSEDDLIALSEDSLISLLSDDERELLGKEFIKLHVDRPATVYVVRSTYESGEIFWLEDRGFRESELTVTAGNRVHAVWEKEFAAGPVGLGINTFVRSQDPCFFLLRANDSDRALQVRVEEPDYIERESAQVGALPYADDLMEINELPEELVGAVLVRPKRWVRDHARLIHLFRRTRYPSTKKPDQVVLTWSEDPRTTQTIQWRTGPEVVEGRVAYVKKSEYRRFVPAKPSVMNAKTVAMKTPDVVNDPLVKRHTVILRNLEPGTTYLYSVGDGLPGSWTELAEFTTAPETGEPFSFMYLGDVQNGMDRWHSLMHTAFRERPDASFYLLAGDLVNRGVNRDDWDDFFRNGEAVFRQRPLVPVIGNHEGYGLDRHPTLYLDLFELPENGPEKLEAERVYSFEYGNVLFLILDSMLPAESQTAWMEVRLAESKATWKFAVFHFPLYSANPERDYKSLRESWVPIFDRYQFDMVLQGHDHVYARSFPLYANQPVAEAADGTYYVIAYAGTKSYGEGQASHTEVNFDSVSTYQVIDIQVSSDRLLYRAYDIDGNLKDELVIEK